MKSGIFYDWYRIPIEDLRKNHDFEHEFEAQHGEGAKNGVPFRDILIILGSFIYRNYIRGTNFFVEFCTCFFIVFYMFSEAFNVYR